jgi:hypothetical protein
MNLSDIALCSSQCLPISLPVNRINQRFFRIKTPGQECVSISCHWPGAHNTELKIFRRFDKKTHINHVGSKIDLPPADFKERPSCKFRSIQMVILGNNIRNGHPGKEPSKSRVCKSRSDKKSSFFMINRLDIESSGMDAAVNFIRVPMRP